MYIKKYPHANVCIDNRIREIFYGKYSHQKNNSELDETRKKQTDGDYFVRFGEYGDNKFDIENRLTNFLLDIYNNNNKDNTVLIVSHGSIISYMKRILNIKSGHLKKGKIDIFNDVDFNNLLKHNEFLKNISKFNLYKN